MKINILFFASLREQLECHQIELQCPSSANIADIKQLLEQKGPQWQKVFASSAILTAVNQTMVEADYVVKEHDEVAFFPPVTGG